jgi:aspartate/tyrosine/aromatic aminotransferase
VSAAARLVLGADARALAEGRVVSVQTISGTGANHLAALFLSRFYQFSGAKQVYLSDPTWGALLFLAPPSSCCRACSRTPGRTPQ